ncbi:MAG: hypothetical protein HRF49_09260 [bacterium]
MRKAVAILAVLAAIAIYVGAPRAQMSWDGVHSVAIGPDGALYFLYGPDIERRINKRVENINSDQGVSAEMSRIRVAPDGTIFANDLRGGRVLRISGGQAETILTKGDPRISPDPFISGRFQPDGLAIDSAGNIFIGDIGNGWLLQYDNSGQVKRLAGVDPVYEGAGEGARITQESKGLFDGPALQAKLRNPSYLAVGPDGSIFIAEGTDGLIRQYKQGNLTTIAGGLKPDGTREVGFRDGPGTSALLGWQLTGLAADKEGNLFVMDNQNHCVRQLSWDAASGMYYVYTLAGSPKNPGTNKDGNGFNADFASYLDLVVDSKKTLYLANSSDYNIRTVSWMGEVRTINVR